MRANYKRHEPPAGDSVIAVGYEGRQVRTVTIGVGSPFHGSEVLVVNYLNVLIPRVERQPERLDTTCRISSTGRQNIIRDPYSFQ